MCPRCDDERLLPKIAALAVKRDRKERQDDLPDPLRSHDHYGRSPVIYPESVPVDADETTVEKVKEQLKEMISVGYSNDSEEDRHV